MFEDGRPQPIAVFSRGDAPAHARRDRRSQPEHAHEDARGADRGGGARAIEPSRRRDVRGDVQRSRGARAPRRPAVHEQREGSSRPRWPRSAPRAETALYDGVAEGLQHLRLGHSGQARAGHRERRRRQRQSRDLRPDPGARAAIRRRHLRHRPPGHVRWPRKTKTRGCSSGSATTRAASPTFRGRPTRCSRCRPRSAATSGNSTRSASRPANGLADARSERSEVTVTAPGQGRLHVRTRSGYLAGGAKGGNDEDTP